MLYGRINFSEWQPDNTGATDITVLFEEAVNYAAEKHLMLEINNGRYRLDNSHAVFTDLENFAIRSRRNTVFVDEGRSMVGYSNTSFKIPYGIEFVGCRDFLIENGLFKSNVSGGGSSNNLFNTTTCSYTLRKPVLGFYECTDVYVIDTGREGSPGRGISGFDLGLILDELGLEVGVNLTKDEYNYFAHRSHHRNFYRCNNVFHIGGWSKPGSGDREQISFTGGSNLYWMNERHTNNTAEPDMASLGKIIGVDTMFISGFRVKDPSDSSFIDLVGQNVTIFDMYADIPNGKMIDISHEHGVGSSPCSNIFVRDFRTTGRGPVSAVVSTPEQDVLDAPITDLIFEDCDWAIGKTDFSEVIGPSMGTVKEYTIRRRVGVNESPAGSSFTLGGGSLIRIEDSSYTWTKNSSSLGMSNRTVSCNTRNEYVNVHWKLNTSKANTGNGLATLSFTTNNNGIHIFTGGSFTDSNISVAGNANVMMISVTLDRFNYTVTSGTIKFVNCLKDGIAFNT